jgi:hypothetical protein
MLENHLLDDLDEDLLLELDEVVRGNQLNCLPFAKSERAVLLLHERHPSLAGDIDEERQRRIRDMAFREALKDDDNRLSSSYRARIGSLDDMMSGSPSQEKTKRKSKATRNAPFSPIIRPKDSTVDLMFYMDDDDPLAPVSPKSPILRPTPDEPRMSRTASATIPLVCDDGESHTPQDDDLSSLPARPTGLGIRNITETPPSVHVTKTWSSPTLPSSKLDMKEIMAQASSNRTSNLSMSLSAQKIKDEAGPKTPSQKLSQKERKKQQQAATSQSQIAKSDADTKLSSPWQIASSGSKTSVKDVLTESKSSSSLAAQPLGLPFTSRPLTPRRTASPDTRFSGQARIISSTRTKEHSISTSGPSRNMSQAAVKSSPIIPHSKSYLTPAVKAEPSLQLSMADIIGQQKREQEVFKEAVAKKSLQEIQEEQAFQEWWDQESRRAQEEESSRAKNLAPAAPKGSKAGGGRGKSGTRGRGGGRGSGRRGRVQESTTGGTGDA